MLFYNFQVVILLAWYSECGKERVQQLLSSREEELDLVSGAGMYLHAETCPSAMLLLLLCSKQTFTPFSEPHLYKSGMALPGRVFVFLSCFPFGLSLPLIRQDFKKGQTVPARGLCVTCQGS